MEMRSAVTKAIGLANGASKGISNYKSVGACVSGRCEDISIQKLYYRLDEIEHYIKTHPNELLLIADTYYMAYTERGPNKYLIIIGGHDGIANDIQGCNYSLNCILKGIVNVMGINTSKDVIEYFYEHAYDVIKRTVIVVFKYRE